MEKKSSQRASIHTPIHRASFSRVKGSLVGIDRILRSWIRKINHYSLIFLNAFMLMVEPRMAKMLDLTGGQRSDEYFQKLAKKQGFSRELIQSVLDEAMSSDYDHLVRTLLDNMEE